MYFYIKVHVHMHIYRRKRMHVKLSPPLHKYIQKHAHAHTRICLQRMEGNLWIHAQPNSCVMSVLFYLK